MILVTGGTGFVGGHVVHELRGRDLPVRCLVRDPRKATKLTGWGCELAEGDVTDEESLRRAVAGVDTIVHLVAIRQGPREQFQRIMVDGTRDLLSAARDAGVAPVRPHERPRYERGDQGARPLLLGEVGERAAVRTRASRS